MEQFLDFNDDNTLAQRPRLKEACGELHQMASQLGAGGKLPTMIELRTQLGMSLGTINDAVRELERHGILRSVNGVGIYVAQMAEQKLARKLGLFFRVPSLRSDYYMTDLMSGIQVEAARHNLEIILLNENEETIASGKVDAVLIYCHPTEALLLNLPSKLPNALLFQHSPEFTCVAVDDFEGQKLATQHLLEQGHRRICYLPSSNHDSISRQRLAGYAAAYKEAGISFDEKWVRFLNRPRTAYRVAAESVMKAWLEEGWHELNCTAILAANDSAAIGIMQALHANGLRVPDDVSVVGFDGTEISDLSSPQLTTIKVPLQEVGAHAVKVLWTQMMEGTGISTKVVLPVQLKEGKSTLVKIYEEETIPHYVGSNSL